MNNFIANVMPLLDGVRNEIQELEAAAVEAKRDGHVEQSVIYEFSAMRFRVLLTGLGFSEPSKRVLEHEKEIAYLSDKVA